MKVHVNSVFFGISELLVKSGAVEDVRFDPRRNIPRPTRRNNTHEQQRTPGNNNGSAGSAAFIPILPFQQPF
jgi:hypothetical protein